MDLDRKKRDQRATLELLSTEELDELVHDAKGGEAAEINNSGKAAQICYLTESEG